MSQLHHISNYSLVKKLAKESVIMFLEEIKSRRASVII